MSGQAWPSALSSSTLGPRGALGPPGASGPPGALALQLRLEPPWASEPSVASGLLTGPSVASNLPIEPSVASGLTNRQIRQAQSQSQKKFRVHNSPNAESAETLGIHKDGERDELAMGASDMAAHKSVVIAHQIQVSSIVAASAGALYQVWQQRGERQRRPRSCVVAEFEAVFI